MHSDEYNDIYEQTDGKSYERKVLDYLDYITDDAVRKLAYTLLTDVDGNKFLKYKDIIERYHEFNQ
jgi:hypothetical protein